MKSRARYIQTLNKSDFPHIFKTILKNARATGVEFTLTLDWVLSQFERQKGRCAKTGIVLQAGPKSPWSPSLDKINPADGYTEDNVQIVCLMFNYCKHTWKEEDVRTFAKALLTDDGIPQFPVGVGFRAEEDL